MSKRGGERNGRGRESKDFKEKCFIMATREMAGRALP
jgi:hypothetical protein